MDLKKKIKNFPLTPGVYLFKDKYGSIIYIGKAKKLRKRVESYFIQKRHISPKIEVLIKNISDVDAILTKTEEESLILEAALIKEKQPKYNTLAKDDKSYPYIKITVQEKYPRLLITRDRKKDNALYFGPYTQVKLLNSAVRILQKLFPMRTCYPLGKKICLEYHIGQCTLAPCVNKDIREEYDDLVNGLKLFLSGKQKDLLKKMCDRMQQFADQLEFEKADRIKKSISMLNHFPHVSTINYKDEMTELARVIALKTKPTRLECFDISNISGANAVGSMVCFKNGKPLKKDYRKFRIKSVSGINDYAMMKEVIYRRYEGTLKAKLPRPDLIVVDGGKGHLMAAHQSLKKTAASEIPIIGIAKKNEDIYLVSQSEPIRLSRNSDALHLIQRLRDEAHRFAITYHKNLRSHRSLTSVLDSIEGIGPKKKMILLKHFPSIGLLKKADKFNLLDIKGIGKKDAEKITEFFKNEKIYTLSD